MSSVEKTSLLQSEARNT